MRSSRTSSARLSRRRVFGAALLLSAFALTPARALQEVVEETGLALSGLTPGSTAFALAVAQETKPGFVDLWRRDQVLIDRDQDGAVRWDVPLVPDRSVWISVALTNGESALSAPEGSVAKEQSWPGGTLLSSDPTVKPHVLLALPTAHLLWVRPGVGAWGSRGGDGALNDLDLEVDGTLRLRLSTFEPLDGVTAERPLDAQAGDVFVVVDPESLIVSRATVGVAIEGESEITNEETEEGR